MNCKRVRALLPRYVDQDLEAEERGLVAGHLAACEDCRRRLALNRELMVALAEMPAPLGESQRVARLRQNVLAGVERERTWRPLWRTVLTVGNGVAWLGVSAVVAALILALSITWRPLIEGRMGRALAPTSDVAYVSGPSPSPSPEVTPEVTPTPEESPAGPAAPPPHTEATPGPTVTPAPGLVPYSDAAAGFTVQYPAGWQVSRGAEFDSLQRLSYWATFTSDYYAGDTQAIGRYTVRVTVTPSTRQTVAQAVEAWLAPIDPSVRAGIGQRELVVAGEPAVELTALPGYRFGGHMVVVLHEGHEYRLTFAPDRAFGTPRDADAQAAFDVFMRTLAFIPLTEALPAPTPPGPVPTATPGPAAVSSLIVTPHDPPVLYAVTGGRLYRSLDRGASWTTGGEAGLPAGAGLSVVAVDYGHPDTMYALTDQGLYHRQGNGEWGFVSGLQATALAVDLQDPTVLWAGARRSPERDAVILRSADGGRTWAKADLGIPNASGDEWVANIAPNPNDPSLLWAVVRSAGRGTLYRGDRSGQWQPLRPPELEGDGACSFTGLAYDPNAGLLFAGCDADAGGTMRLLRAANAGAADPGAVLWQEAAVWTGAPGVGWARPLAVDAREPKSLYLSLGAGPLEVPGLASTALLVSHNGGLTWEPFGAGLAPVGPSQ